MKDRAARDALIAINEALRCLDFDATGTHRAEGEVDQATDALMVARDLLGGREWPEIPLGSEAERRAWLDARELEQKADGRL